MKLFKVLIMCLCIALVLVGCKTHTTSDLPATTPEEVQPTISPEQMIINEMGNETTEKAVRIILRSYCEDNFKLFALMAKKSETDELKSRFDSMKKEFVGRDYKKIPLYLAKLYGDNCLSTDRINIDTGKKIPWGDNQFAQNRIFTYKADDDHYYFSDFDFDY